MLYMVYMYVHIFSLPLEYKLNQFKTLFFIIFLATSKYLICREIHIFTVCARYVVLVF